MDKQGFGFGGTGKKSFGRQFDTYGEVEVVILMFCSYMYHKHRVSSNVS